MRGLILVVPLACVPVAAAAADPMNSTRELAPFFLTLQIDQAIGEEPGLPMLGARVTGVFQRRFGLEASLAKVGPFATLAELSAVAVVKLVADSVLLRAGVSHVPGAVTYANADIGDRDAATGFHVGASLFTGDVDDRVRMRFDYTYRQFAGQDRGFSSLGLGVVFGWEPD